MAHRLRGQAVSADLPAALCCARPGCGVRPDFPGRHVSNRLARSGARHLLVRPARAHLLLRHSGRGMAWVPVVFACAVDLRPMVVFATRPMRLLGAISFGTYLLHPVIFAGAAAAGLTGRAWAGPVMLAAVIVAAWLAHVVIEKPAL